LKLCTVFLLAGTLVHAQTSPIRTLRTGSLVQRVKAALASSPEAKQATWGIHVVDLATKSEIYALNQNRFFIPASNAKLLSSALALTRLGPDYKYVTRVQTKVLPDAEGRVGDVFLVGGGDPNLSARVLPYQKDAVQLNPLEAIEQLADGVIARGVREITGDIVGDDTRYVHEPFPDGWSVDDPIWEFGAPTGALVVNDNAFTMYVDPGGKPDEPGLLTLVPPMEHMVLHNRTRTVLGGDTDLKVERVPGSSELVVRGTVGSTRRRVLLAVPDAALFAAQAFRSALQRKGVVVRGEAVARHRRVDDSAEVYVGVELSRRESQPFVEDLGIILKESQNLHAEIALLEAGKQAEPVGSREAALKELKKFLTEAEIAEKQYDLRDGSGLSRLTLLTPFTLTKVLAFMYGSPHRDLWLSALPVGGFDGTLRARFVRTAQANRILAKTGSVSHVSALAGYALRKDGKTYAFSIVVNGFSGGGSAARTVIDRIALALLN
jgi:D-alanyl-D-alanine carboxypeptidase/D-alanyl-D-alanine-endopeptidase (penicillin-binding protein 4)